MSRMVRRKKEMELSDVETQDDGSQDEGSQDEGFGESANTMPQRPPRRPELNPVRSQLDHAFKAAGINAPPLKWFTEKPFLLVLLLGLLLVMLSSILSLYIKVYSLQNNTESLLEKIHQLENLSVENFSKMNTQMENLNEGSSFIQQEHNKFSQKLQESNTKLSHENSLLATNTKGVTQLKVTIEQLIVNFRKLNESFIVLGTVVANCSEQVDKCKETAERVEGVIDDETYLSSSIKIFKKEVKTLTINISSVNGTLSAESKKIDNLQLLLETVQKKHGEIIKMDAKLDETQQSVSNLEEDITKLAEEIGKYQKEFPSISKIPDKVQTLNTTKEDVSSDKWLWIQRTTAGLGLITFHGILFYKKIDVMEKQIKYLTEYKGKLSLKYGSACIVDQIKRKQPKELANKFCVISFSQETHNKHRKITRHSVEGRLRIKNMDEADFVVTNGKSVLNIPPCKVLLVFVDHNYQNVILENPIEDDEDIKLLTVQACRKIGAEVFVIYVGDEGSKSLECLYNPELTTVRVHFELKQLAQRKRVITCYEKFTITQREKVAQAIV